MKLVKQKNRFIGQLLFGMLSAWVTLSSAVPLVTITGPSSISQGSNFTLDVNITGAADLYAFQFDLAFDPTVLKILVVSEGPMLPSAGATFLVPGTIDNSAGSLAGVADTLVGLVPGINGDGVLFSINVNALSAGVSVLTFSNQLYLDSALTDITTTVTTSNGNVTVSPSTGIIPAPSTLALSLLGLVCVPLATRRTRENTGGYSRD